MQLSIIERQPKAHQTALDALSPSPISCISDTLAIAFSYSHSSVRQFDSLAINRHMTMRMTMEMKMKMTMKR